MVSISMPDTTTRPSVPLKQPISLCDIEHNAWKEDDTACGFWIDYGICVNNPDVHTPRYLAQPIVTHREQPVQVEESCGRCLRTVTRHRSITLLYRTADDMPQRLVLKDAFCVQQLIEAFAKGTPVCPPC